MSEIDKKYTKDMLKHRCDECVHFFTKWWPSTIDYCEYGVTDEQVNKTPYKPREEAPVPKLRICPMFSKRAYEWT
jgi:hypothetical protein